jgi:hypothetical protein
MHFCISFTFYVPTLLEFHSRNGYFNSAIEWSIHLLHIQKVPGSHSGLETDIVTGFCGFRGKCCNCV